MLEGQLEQAVHCSVMEQASTQSTIVVTVSADLVTTLYNYIVRCHKRHSSIAGFVPGTVPIDYIERNFKTSICEQVKDFISTFFVQQSLFTEIMRKKIILLGNPDLRIVSIKAHQPAIFTFSINHLPLNIYANWKPLPFRAPNRKNYRDLDHQVTTFLHEETARVANHSPNIMSNDWVAFTISPLDEEQQSLFGSQHRAQLWLKVSNEETDHEQYDTIKQRTLHETFTTQARFLQEYYNASYDTQYQFAVGITHHSKNHFFCIDTFKRHFKIKTARELHQKLIEVFSFRHDVSQRRETAEMVLRLLLKHNPFSIAPEIVEAQEARILEIIYHNPDYYVYKGQEDFPDKVHTLALKQLKEAAIVAAIAYTENIQITPQDMLSYLNLMKRPRTKEFIYFNLPNTSRNERQLPIHDQELYHNCLLEKTLNHIIYTLTRK